MSILLILLSVLFSCSQVKFAGEKGYDVLNNQHFQKYTSAACFWAYAYYDATADAVLFQNRNQMIWGEEYYPIYGAKYEQWHGYKNYARGFLVTSAVLKGMEIATNTDIKYIGMRALSESLIAWDIWQWRKHYVQSGNAFDYSSQSNQHLFVIPFLGNDRYIGMSGGAIGGIQLTIGLLGLYGFIIY